MLPAAGVLNPHLPHTMSAPSSLRLGMLLALVLALTLAPSVWALECPPFTLAEGNCKFDDVKGSTYGCHKGYCWSKCIEGLTKGRFDWWYTTQGARWDSQYIPCSSNDDCCQFWKCAGACSFI
jgi:hypothetical protein